MTSTAHLRWTMATAVISALLGFGIGIHAERAAGARAKAEVFRTTATDPDTVHTRINALRREHGLAPLHYSPEIEHAATVLWMIQSESGYASAARHADQVLKPRGYRGMHCIEKVPFGDYPDAWLKDPAIGKSAESALLDPSMRYIGIALEQVGGTAMYAVVLSPKENP